MQRSALCRSRRELSNAYLLAKIGVDTAENEPPRSLGEKYSILFIRVLTRARTGADGSAYTESGSRMSDRMSDLQGRLQGLERVTAGGPDLSLFR